MRENRKVQVGWGHDNMKIREHRGSLLEAMETVSEIEPTKMALVEFIRKAFSHWPGYQLANLEGRVKVEKYRYDERIKWDTHIVTIEGYGVFGFTDGPLLDGVTTVEIHKCPSCGSLPEIVSESWYYVRCPKCGNCERGVHATKEEAISAWNSCFQRWRPQAQGGRDGA